MRDRLRNQTMQLQCLRQQSEDSRPDSSPEGTQVDSILLQPGYKNLVVQLDQRGDHACEACANQLEKQLGHLDGIRHARANYQDGVLSVTYDDGRVSPERIIHSVRQFTASQTPCDEAAITWEEVHSPTEQPSRLQDWLSAERLESLFTTVTLLAIIGALVARRLNLPTGIETACFVIAYLAGGTFGFKRGIESLRQLVIDVDLLMVMAAIGAWIVGSPAEGAMLLFLFSISNVLQAYAFNRTRSAIRSMMNLSPKQALTRREGAMVVVPVEDLKLGDVVVVRPGERIPTDGMVIEGQSSVDQSSITGESMPVSKQPGEDVLGGTINQSGSLDIEVTKLAKDSTIAKMIRLVEVAQSEKARTQRFLEKFEQYYAVGVIGVTLLLVFVPTLVLGEAFNTAFYRAMTVMVAASPCALVISTPAAILSAIGNGARRGILFKGGVHLEQAARIKVVAFDKTGTLTRGRPYVTYVKPLQVPEIDWMGGEEDLLVLAASVEGKSEHPFAQAIVRLAEERELDLVETTQFFAETGKGARARLNGYEIRIGGLRYFEHMSLLDAGPLRQEVKRLQEAGSTPLMVVRIDGGDVAYVLGIIGVADVLRADAAQVVQELKMLGVERVVMLTGDGEGVARVIAGQAGVDDFHADLMPADKVRIVKEEAARFGPVAMVGDGVNDAPALATATVGIAMGAAGTDVAMETANIVLMSDDLHNIPYVIALSRRTRKTLISNLSFALMMIGLMLISIFAIQLTLPLVVLGHEGGTVLVSLNGMRLLFHRYLPPTGITTTVKSGKAVSIRSTNPAG